MAHVITGAGGGGTVGKPLGGGGGGTGGTRGVTVQPVGSSKKYRIEPSGYRKPTAIIRPPGPVRLKLLPLVQPGGALASDGNAQGSPGGGGMGDVPTGGGGNGGETGDGDGE